MLSALQHWSYCPRQCALIHLEQAFDENVHTMRAEGNLPAAGADGKRETARAGNGFVRGRGTSARAAYSCVSASAGENVFTPVSGGKCLLLPVMMAQPAASAAAIKGASSGSGKSWSETGCGFIGCATRLLFSRFAHHWSAERRRPLDPHPAVPVGACQFALFPPRSRG